MITDVLIIGGGVTARRAAAIVSERYSVILAEDGAGASPYIHGLNVPLLEDDSKELFLTDTLESGKYQNNRALAKALTDGSIDVIGEFKDEFDKNDDGSFNLLKPLGSSLPRVAGICGRTGAKILHDLRKNAKYTDLSNTRVLKLIKSGESVVGAQVFDKKAEKFFPIYAKAVLIACGGFGGIFPFSTNSRDIGGDGIAAAYEAGAELVDMEFIQYEPTVAIYPEEIAGKSIITTMLFEGAVIRNKDGERFMDEKVGKDLLSVGICREILRGGATERGGVYFDMTAVPEDMLLGKYHDYFDRYFRVGIDIRKTPVEIIPAPHTTMGGIKIDEHCRTTLDGLFAAGEASGGLHGANRLGGNAGLEVLVFGDIAGRSILDYLDKKLYVQELPSSGDGENADVPWDNAKLRAELHRICKDALGVIKNGDALKKAAGEIENIISSASEHLDSFGGIRLYNDAVTIKLVIFSALLRRESIGGHIRADSTPESGEKYCIVLKNDNGTLTERRDILK